MFNLAYGLNWSYHDMMDMPVEDLLLFHALLEEQWDREKRR